MPRAGNAGVEVDETRGPDCWSGGLTASRWAFGRRRCGEGCRRETGRTAKPRKVGLKAVPFVSAHGVATICPIDACLNAGKHQVRRPPFCRSRPQLTSVKASVDRAKLSALNDDWRTPGKGSKFGGHACSPHLRPPTLIGRPWIRSVSAPARLVFGSSSQSPSLVLTMICGVGV